MDNDKEEIFFSSMYKALVKEDESLKKIFEENNPRYAHQHHGICCLYETTIVYLIFRQLLIENFPYTVFWEQPYPNNHNLKADMGILNDDQSINSLIEFKIWTSENGDEVRGDVLKYLQSNFNGGRYLAIVEYGGPDIDKSCKYLMNMNPELEFINKKSFPTCYFDSMKTHMHIYNPINLYFFKINCKFQ